VIQGSDSQSAVLKIGQFCLFHPALDQSYIVFVLPNNLLVSYIIELYYRNTTLYYYYIYTLKEITLILFIFTVNLSTNELFILIYF